MGELVNAAPGMRHRLAVHLRLGIQIQNGLGLEPETEMNVMP